MKSLFRNLIGKTERLSSTCMTTYYFHAPHMMWPTACYRNVSDRIFFSEIHWKKMSEDASLCEQLNEAAALSDAPYGPAVEFTNHASSHLFSQF